MNRAQLGDVELEYEVHGSGVPVMLIHPGIFVDWFAPLFQEPALTTRYRLVHYHRVGCAGSSHVTGRVTLAQYAAHARSLMDTSELRKRTSLGTPRVATSHCNWPWTPLTSCDRSQSLNRHS